MAQRKHNCQNKTGRGLVATWGSYPQVAVEQPDYLWKLPALPCKRKRTPLMGKAKKGE